MRRQFSPPRLLRDGMIRRWWFRGSVFGLISLAMAVVMANTYNVTSTADGAGAITGGPTTFSATTLRAAITAADAAGGTHLINVPPGSYQLALGELRLGNRPQSVTINGTGTAAATILQTAPTSPDRILLINPPGTNSEIVTILQNLTFTGGRLTSDTFGGGAILAGGPNNSLTVHSCVFDRNTVPDGNGTGGAINFSGGGDLTIDQGSVFSNNQDLDSGGGGGAVWFFLGNNVSGSISISGCSFANNSTAAAASATSGGGALGIQTQGSLGHTTFSASISGSNFAGNGAPAGLGGAVLLIDSFGGMVSFNYNRVFGNTASDGTSLAVISESGQVDASNDWWGCNAGPGSSGCDQATLVSNGGTAGLKFAPWITLTQTAQPNVLHTPGGAPPQSATLIASFLQNSAGQLLNSAQLTALAGVPILFTHAINGLIANPQSSIQSSATATATFNAVAAGLASADATLDDQTVTASLTVTTLVAPTIDAIKMTQLGAQIFFSGLPGEAISIEGSTDLVTWQSLTSVTLSGASGQFVDFFGLHLPLRFYRASTGP
jgi:hypothetical protein